LVLVVVVGGWMDGGGASLRAQELALCYQYYFRSQVLKVVIQVIAV
jgi:hypothetical protein